MRKFTCRGYIKTPDTEHMVSTALQRGVEP